MLTWILSVPLSAWADANLAEAAGQDDGTSQIKDNPTQVSAHLGHPVHKSEKMYLSYQGVISGAMLLIEEDERIEPNTLWKELIVSATVRAFYFTNLGKN